MGYRNIVLSLLDEAAERVAAAKKSILSAAEGGNPGGPDVWSCWAALLDAQRKIGDVEAELLESCGEPRK